MSKETRAKTVNRTTVRDYWTRYQQNGTAVLLEDDHGQPDLWIEEGDDGRLCLQDINCADMSGDDSDVDLLVSVLLDCAGNNGMCEIGRLPQWAAEELLERDDIPDKWKAARAWWLAEQGEWPDPQGESLDEWTPEHHEVLYRTPTGEYFLRADGDAMDDAICIRLTGDEAEEWLEAVENWDELETAKWEKERFDEDESSDVPYTPLREVDARWEERKQCNWDDVVKAIEGFLRKPKQRTR